MAEGYFVRLEEEGEIEGEGEDEGERGEEENE